MLTITQFEVEEFMNKNEKFFSKEDIKDIKQTILTSNVTIDELNTLNFKSPYIGVVLSIVLGFLGIDRLYSGNYILAVFKLATGGFWGIGWIVDWFLIAKKIKIRNYDILYDFLHGEIHVLDAKFTGDDSQPTEINELINGLVAQLEPDENQE